MSNTLIATAAMVLLGLKQAYTLPLQMPHQQVLGKRRALPWGFQTGTHVHGQIINCRKKLKKVKPTHMQLMTKE